MSSSSWITLRRGKWPKRYCFQLRCTAIFRIIADALPIILGHEKRLAEKANAEREEARRQVRNIKKRRKREKQLREEEARAAISLTAALGIVLVLSWFALIIYIYIKYDKIKHSFEGIGTAG